MLVWLEIDATLRRLTDGQRGMDDFARGFFGLRDRDWGVVTFTVDDIVRELNGIAPYDWAGFLRRWIDGHEELDVSEGLAQQGWRLVYTDTATATYRQNEKELEATDLSYSIGLTVADSGLVRAIAWNGPAYRAGIGPRTKIVSVGGVPFTREALIEAVRHAAETPIGMTFEQDGRTVTRILDYRGTLRYPRLQRIAGRPDRLRTLLAPRRK
jgi:predicted metalloprotease with PDZ domain